MRARSLSVAAIAVALLASGCAGPRMAGCAEGQLQRVHDALYFGTATPDGTVSADDWRAFVDSVLTPRFPDGLTVVPAAGQWKSAAGSIVREASYIVTLVHPPGPESESAIAEIVSAYKSRFRQEAVMRVQAPACVSF